MVGKLKITQPVHQQVIQRNQRNRAVVQIRGITKVGFDSMEVRTILAEGCAGQAFDWQPLEWRSAGKGEFQAEATLPAGGWYRLEVRAKKGGRIVAQGFVPRIGIGEVFAITGQSNAANCGESRLQPGDDRVVAYNEGVWVEAADPQPGSQGEGGSWIPPLGTMLAQSLQVPIGFVGSALGGSALAWWFPFPHRAGTPKFPDTPKEIFGTPVENFHLYENLLRRVGAQGTYGIRAVLWHQGESDGIFNTPAELYCSGMQFLIRQLNKDLGWKVPWVVARASYLPNSTDRQRRNVIEGQRLIWDRGVALQGPSTDDLLGPQYRYDTVHFSAYGLQVHASRWFAALWAHFFADRPLGLRSPIGKR